MAYVVPTLEGPSGWRSLSIGIVEAMRRSGAVEPLLIVSDRDRSLAATLLPGCDVAALPRTQFLSTASWTGRIAAVATRARARRSVRSGAVLVHSLEAYPTGLVGHWAAGARMPHVITAAGTYGVRWAEHPDSARRYARVLSRAAAVLPISHGTADLMSQHFGRALQRTVVRVVLLGTDYHARVPRDVAAERTSPPAPVVLSVGAVKPRKGYHTSLRAFGRVQRAYPTAQYRIVGRIERPAYRAELDRIVAAERIDGVTFVEDASDAELDRQYREASVFLLTPEPQGLSFEGFGLVYLEAGAYGLPVVATATGGVPDAVHDEETGLLAAPGDVDGIAARLLRLARDADLSRRLGLGNRHRAELLTWERFASEQREVYEHVLARRGGPGQGNGEARP